MRDLILGRKSKDLDFLIDGNQKVFEESKKELSKLFPPQSGSLNEFPQFFTARWRSADGFRVDCARARKEIYPRPGALPQVHAAGSVIEDLGRRDFTVNAIAVGIGQFNWGQIIDPYYGIKDIENKVIRVLHPQSFQDDPTRLLRALRFSVRLGFAMGPKTRSLWEQALRNDYFQTISWQRKRDEILKGFAEEQWLNWLRELKRCKLFPELPVTAFPDLSRAQTTLQSKELRLLIVYSLQALQYHSVSGQVLSKLSWPTKELRQALEDIESLARFHWRASKKINPLALAALKYSSPYLFKVFSRERPFLLTGEDYVTLGIPEISRSRLQEQLNCRILKGEIRVRAQALQWLKSIK